jgi:hypothetical protein
VNEKESGRGEMAHTSDKKKDTRKTKPLEKTRRKRTEQEKPTGGKTGGGKKNTTSDRVEIENQQKKKSIVAEMENNRLLNSKSVYILPLSIYPLITEFMHTSDHTLLLLEPCSLLRVHNGQVSHQNSVLPNDQCDATLLFL